MDNLRIYGNVPYRVAVVHGGPGAAGEMALVARQLAHRRGVLEPLQTKPTLEGQASELEDTLAEHGQPPMVLIGHSWGAILSFVVAARSPSLVRKLILVSSAPFEDRYAASITETRLSRLNDREIDRVRLLSEALDNPATPDRDLLFAEVGELLSKADSFDPLPAKSEVIRYCYDIYRSVWSEAQEVRSSGRLTELARNIECPVVAIHGDFDPHPAAGVEAPLSRWLRDFRLVLLRRCGHSPWLERAARKEFYAVLEEELK